MLFESDPGRRGELREALLPEPPHLWRQMHRPPQPDELIAVEPLVQVVRGGRLGEHRLVYRSEDSRLGEVVDGVAGPVEVVREGDHPARRATQVVEAVGYGVGLAFPIRHVVSRRPLGRRLVLGDIAAEQVLDDTGELLATTGSDGLGFVPDRSHPDAVDGYLPGGGPAG